MKKLEVAYLVYMYTRETGNQSFTYRQLQAYINKKRPDLHPNTVERVLRYLADEGYLDRDYVKSRKYNRRIAVFRITDKLVDLLRFYGVRT